MACVIISDCTFITDIKGPLCYYEDTNNANKCRVKVFCYIIDVIYLNIGKLCLYIKVFWKW